MPHSDEPRSVSCERVGDRGEQIGNGKLTRFSVKGYHAPPSSAFSFNEVNTLTGPTKGPFQHFQTHRTLLEPF